MWSAAGVQAADLSDMADLLGAAIRESNYLLHAVH